MTVDQVAMDADQETEAELARAESIRTEALAFATRHIPMFCPFTTAARKRPTRRLVNFARLAEDPVISHDDLLVLLDRTLREILADLRVIIHTMPQLDAIRVMVLVHVACEIGTAELQRLTALWSAIRDRRWDDAADEIQLTRWPTAATREEDQRRVLQLARMMRTGKAVKELAA